MGDKECASYEALANSGQKTASTTIQLPVLTSKPVKQQQGGLTKDSQSEAPSSGYYLNVAQKGKLILPTALWLLLIVAGISFLTLLASLNKTVDTLDTLIEMEQEKEARQERLHHIRDSINEHHHIEHNNNKQASDDNKADLFDWRHSKKDHDDGHQHGRHFRDGPPRAIIESNDNQDRFLDSLTPIKASWFALPSWTSLEPSASSGLHVEQSPMMRTKPARRHEHHKFDVQSNDLNRSPMPPQIENMMDDMMRQMMALDSPGRVVSESAAPEISGSFIVSSSSDLGMKIRGESGANMDNRPTDFMDSIMKQIMPVLSGGLTDLPNELPGKKEKATKNEAPHQTMGPMISAKIDNLNINLNDGSSSSSNNDDDANTGDESEDKKSASHSRPSAIERNEIEELEKSIDSMVSKLMNRKSNEMPLILDLNANEAKPLVQDHFALRPIGSGLKAHHGNHHHHSEPAGEFKSSQMFPLPMSSFLMPFDFSSSPSSPSPKEATTLTKKLLSINKDQDQNETDADKAAVEQVFKELKDQLEFEPMSGQPASLVADQTFGDQNNLPSFPSIDPLSVFVIPSQAPESEQTKGPNEPKETASKDPAESLMNDFIGSMFTMPQFDGGNQRQVSTSGGDSSSGGSSASAGSSGGSMSPTVLIETNTPSSTMAQLDGSTSTTKASSASSVETQTSTETPISIDTTASQVAAESPLKPDNLPNDPLLKGFLGISENEPFFLKEDISGPVPIPPVTASLASSETLATTSSKAQKSEPVLSSSTVAPSTSAPSTLKRDESSPLVSSTLNSLVAKQIHEKDVPSDVSVVSLTPLAKSSKLIADIPKHEKIQPPIQPNTSGLPNNSSVIRPSAIPVTIPELMSQNATQIANVTTKVTVNATANAKANSTAGAILQPQQLNNLTGSPLRSFLEKADDFIGRNLLNFRKLF